MLTKAAATDFCLLTTAVQVVSCVPQRTACTRASLTSKVRLGTMAASRSAAVMIQTTTSTHASTGKPSTTNEIILLHHIATNPV